MNTQAGNDDQAASPGGPSKVSMKIFLTYSVKRCPRRFSVPHGYPKKGRLQLIQLTHSLIEMLGIKKVVHESRRP
jgi:hypothetical protein